MVTGRRLGLRLSHALYNDLDGLGYVSFSFLPHLNNPCFVNLKHDTIERAARGAPNPSTPLTIPRP